MSMAEKFTITKTVAKGFKIYFPIPVDSAILKNLMEWDNFQ